MIDQTFIEFIEFLITQLLSDLIFLSCSLQRHFILLLCPRKIFLHLNSLLLDKALSSIIQDVKVYLFDWVKNEAVLRSKFDFAIVVLKVDLINRNSWKVIHSGCVNRPIIVVSSCRMVACCSCPTYRPLIVRVSCNDCWWEGLLLLGLYWVIMWWEPVHLGDIDTC